MHRPAVPALLAAFAGLAVAAIVDAASPTTVPASTQPTTQIDEVKRADLVAEYAAMVHRPAARIGTLLTARVEDNYLHILFTPDTKVDDKAATKPDDKTDATTDAKTDANADAYTFDVIGWPGFVKVEANDRMPAGFNFQHIALTDNDTVYTDTSVTTRPDYLQINRGIESATGTRTVTLIQSAQFAGPNDEAVKLFVQINPNDKPEAAVNLHVAAATFSDLVRDHDDLVRTYLLPILRDLGAADTVRGSDVARAYQVLGAMLPLDAATAKRVDDLLKRLGQDDAADRAKAEEELLALGPAGAAELRRRDLSAIPPDPRATAENAMRSAEPLETERAAALATDVPFLLDTLTLDAPALVSAAAAKLKALTGHAIDLPAGLSLTERGRRIAVYTALVAPTTQSTTQP